MECQICFKMFQTIVELAKHQIVHCFVKLDLLSADNILQLRKGQYEYDCSTCKKNFNNEMDYELHKLDHLKKTLICFKCDQRFTRKEELRRHILKHFQINKFPCNLCRLTFDNYIYLKKHLETHGTQELFKCEICSKTFKLKRYLTKHFEVHLTKKGIKCPQCDKYFKGKNALQSHKSAKHRSSSLHTCPFCSKMFSFLTYLREHLLTHTRETPLKCDHCSATFRNRRNLFNHISQHHTHKDRPFECNQCNAKFSHETALKQHFRIHGERKKYKCPKCPKLFLDKSYSKKHLRIYHKPGPIEKPYNCKICEVKFRLPGSLKSHILAVHSGERPYPCTYLGCDKRFQKWNNLKSHLNTVHGNGERNFKCEHCEKTYKTLSVKKRHIAAVHLKQIEALCTLCNKVFSCKDSLVIHIRDIHTGEKRHQCKICNISFKKAMLLTDHMNWHLGIKPYVCKVCGIAYEKLQTYQVHMKQKHGQKRPQPQFN